MGAIDFERAVLGGVLLDPNHWRQSAVLRPDDFSLDAHSKIWPNLPNPSTLSLFATSLADTTNWKLSEAMGTSRAYWTVSLIAPASSTTSRWFVPVLIVGVQRSSRRKHTGCRRILACPRPRWPKSATI